MAKSRLSEKTLIYQVWPISFIEPQFRGDNRSALKKISDFLPNLSRLDIDYLWLSPIYLSPWLDHGYDVANYLEIDPRFGNLEEFKSLVKTAKSHNVKVMMDLVLNHTSILHPWFKRYPERYCWGKSNHSEWSNLFDGGSSWEFSEDRGEFYLHLFDKSQPDLNWYPNGPTGNPNPVLVQEFQSIANFWLNQGVSGFRLDATQVINKDAKSDHFNPIETTTKYANLATRVISAIFDEPRENTYLLVECLNLSGDMIKFYYNHAPVNAVMDNTPINTVIVTTDQLVAESGLDRYISAIKKSAESCPEGYAHVTESHDGPRFTSAANLSGKDAIDVLFGLHRGERFCSPNTIIVYQGQELGLQNPTREELSDKQMLSLDRQARLRYAHGESLEDLRPTSRANARIPFHMEEYHRQESDMSSCLHYFRKSVKFWRKV